jgi:hypothetical protein
LVAAPFLSASDSSLKNARDDTFRTASEALPEVRKNKARRANFDVM